MLPPSSPEPGPWRTDRLPLIKGPLDAFTDPAIREIVIWACTQCAKSETVLNSIGYAIHYDPAPGLVIYPVEDTSREFSITRLEPMLRATPALAERAAIGNARDNRKSLLSKTFPGMTLELRGCNSPSSLASRSCRYVWVDELDRCPPDVGGEGSAADLARQRVQTYWNSKVILCSTCTLAGQSQIEYEYESSDKRRYWVPCLQCGHMQTLRFEQLDFDHAKSPEQARLAARYRCEACSHEHWDHHKPKMLAGGEWRAEKPGGAKAGFWWNALYSPWVPFGTVAAEYRQGYKDKARHKVFVNCRLAETWQEDYDAPEIDILKRCVDSERASGTMPADAWVLTAGVDVQKDCLYYVVRAWGSQQRSWLVRFGRVLRDDRSIDMIDEIRTADYGGMPIAMMFIDSGYDADLVYDYCMRAQPRNVAPSKGTRPSAQPVQVSQLDRTNKGQPISGGMKLFLCNSAHWKGVVHDRIRTSRGDPGEWRLPGDVPEEYLRSILAEARVPKQHGPLTTYEWVLKDKTTGNHFLDCEAYAAAAAWFPVRVQRMTAPAIYTTPAATASKPSRPIGGRGPIRRSY